MGRVSFSSLRVRLVLLVLLALIPAFGLILWTNLERRSEDRANAEENLVSLAQVTGAQQEQLIEGGRQFLGTLAGLVSQSDEPIDSASCSAALSGLLAQNARYANIGIADAQGTIFCSGLPQTQSADASQRSWFLRAMQTREFAVGDYQVGTITKKETINFGYPVLDQQGNVKGVVFAALDLAWLNNQAAQLRLPEGAVLLLLDQDGTILVRSQERERWVGESAAELPLFQTISAVGEGTTETSGMDGVKRLFAFSPLGYPGQRPYAYLTVGLAAGTVFGNANRTLARNMALLGIVSAVALAAAWFGGDWLVLRGVRALSAAAERVRAGDLSARAGANRSSGEIAELARTFDQMAETLQEREAERQRAEETLSQRASELASSNAELEQFAYVASHDLQEPLRMVSNYTQLLARRYRGKLDDDADEFIGYAIEGATRMQALINDLLSLSRVQTGGQEFASTDTEDVLALALSSLQGSIAESGAEVTHDPLPVVEGDGVQLGQLLQNLIGNAIKFRRDDEPPRVHVSAEPDGERWRFAVRDNGIGIDPSYQERIFVTFQRLHSRDRYSGTGIGLAICRKVVERHGGRIWMEPNADGGTTFSFTLPAAAQETAAAA